MESVAEVPEDASGLRQPRFWIRVFLLLDRLPAKANEPHKYTHTHTHTHTSILWPSGLWAGNRINLDYTEERDSEWQWHQLGHMQICISPKTDNHASTPPLSFFTGQMPFLPPNQQRQRTVLKTTKQSNVATDKKNLQWYDTAGGEKEMHCPAAKTHPTCYTSLYICKYGIRDFTYILTNLMRNTNNHFIAIMQVNLC